jgi:hypothetical protein
MLELAERHQQAVAVARIFQRPYSTIKVANNGNFELDFTYFASGLGLYLTFAP